MGEREDFDRVSDFSQSYATCKWGKGVWKPRVSVFFLALHFMLAPQRASRRCQCLAQVHVLGQNLDFRGTVQTVANTAPSLSGCCSEQSCELHSLQDRRLMAGDTAGDTAGPLVGFRGLSEVPVLLGGDETPTSSFLGGANPIYSLRIK